MTKHMNTVISYLLTKERKSATVPELPSHQPYQPPKQSFAKSHPEQTETTSRSVNR